MLHNSTTQLLQRQRAASGVKYCLSRPRLSACRSELANRGAGSSTRSVRCACISKMCIAGRKELLQGSMQGTNQLCRLSPTATNSQSSCILLGSSPHDTAFIPSMQPPVNLTVPDTAGVLQHRYVSGTPKPRTPPQVTTHPARSGGKSLPCCQFTSTTSHWSHAHSH